MCCAHFRLHFPCYGMRSVMLQINEYDNDDDASTALEWVKIVLGRPTHADDLVLTPHSTLMNNAVIRLA